VHISDTQRFFALKFDCLFGAAVTGRTGSLRGSCLSITTHLSCHFCFCIYCCFREAVLSLVVDALCGRLGLLG